MNGLLRSPFIGLFFFVLFLAVSPGLRAQTLGFDDLSATAGAGAGGGGGRAATAAGTAASLPPWTITLAPAETVAGCHFDPALDAPNWGNFTSVESNTLLHTKRVNDGTCYGISVFVIRYFQWFVLPHLLTDAERSRAGRRSVPVYARTLAKRLALPDAILQEPRGTQAEREALVAPWRLRTLLTARPAVGTAVLAALEDPATKGPLTPDYAAFSKEHSARMFDNQMFLMRLGARLRETVSSWVQGKTDPDSPYIRRIFGRTSFDLMTKGLDDPRLGLVEVGFWSSTRKPRWGHSVLAWRITRHEARKQGSTKVFEAFRVDLWDSNDPDNGLDDAFWYVPDENRFAPTAKYGDLYDDGEAPLVPAGEVFLRPTQMGPGSESALLRFEANVLNQISLKVEKVEARD